MRWKASIVTAIVVATALPCFAQRASPPGLRQDPPEFTEWQVPTTLRHLWSSSQLILLGRVQELARPRLIVTGGSRLVGRIQTIVPFEILKSPPGVLNQPTVGVLQTGGTIDVGGSEVSSAYGPILLRVGQEGVFFLVRSHEGAWQAAWSKLFILTVDPATRAAAITSGFAPMPEFSGKRSVPLDGLLNQLRELKKSGVK